MAKPPRSWDDSLPEKGRLAYLAASQAEREQAIKTATGIIDALPWKGSRATQIQSLAWPRTGVFRSDGAPIRGVPPEVQEATSLLTGFLLADLPIDAAAMGHVFLALGHLLKDA